MGRPLALLKPFLESNLPRRTRSAQRGKAATNECSRKGAKAQRTIPCFAPLRLCVKFGESSRHKSISIACSTGKRQEGLTLFPLRPSCSPQKTRKPFNVLVEGLDLSKSRGDRIRTCDLLVPNQAL